jgi:hypothetical protein
VTTKKSNLQSRDCAKARSPFFYVGLTVNSHDLNVNPDCKLDDASMLPSIIAVQMLQKCNIADSICLSESATYA